MNAPSAAGCYSEDESRRRGHARFSVSVLDPHWAAWYTVLKDLTEVDMRDQWVTSDPNVMMGKPVVAGTRITVELILEKLAAGETIEQILEAHPRLTREAIHAALAFAKEALRADVVYPIAEAAG